MVNLLPTHLDSLENTPWFHLNMYLELHTGPWWAHQQFAPFLTRNLGQKRWYPSHGGSPAIFTEMPFFRWKWAKNRVLAKKNDLMGPGWGPIFGHYIPFHTQYLNHSRIFETPDFDPPRVFEPPKLEFCKKKKKKKSEVWTHSAKNTQKIPLKKYTTDVCTWRYVQNFWAKRSRVMSFISFEKKKVYRKIPVNCISSIMAGYPWKTENFGGTYRVW